MVDILIDILKKIKGEINEINFEDILDENEDLLDVRLTRLLKRKSFSVKQKAYFRIAGVLIDNKDIIDYKIKELFYSIKTLDELFRLEMMLNKGE